MLNLGFPSFQNKFWKLLNRDAILLFFTEETNAIILERLNTANCNEIYYKFLNKFIDDCAF